MKQVLVICDDYWHPAEVLERGFASYAKEGYAFDFVKDAKDVLNPEMVERYDFVICAKSNNISAANENPWFEDGVTEFSPGDLRAYVEKGRKVLFLHSGNAFMKTTGREEKIEAPNQAYIDLVGNYFVSHPARCDVQAHMEMPEHPLLSGVSDFTVRDEHYHCEIVAKDIQVLFTTHSKTGGDHVGAYLRKVGRGEVIVSMPGHLVSVFEEPNYRRFLLNVLSYGTGQETK